MVFNESTVTDFSIEFFSTALPSYAATSLSNVSEGEQWVQGQGEDSTTHFKENSIYKLYFMSSTILVIKSR